MALTWGEILANPTMNRLAMRLNRRWLWMSEDDLLFLFNEFERMHRIVSSKEEQL